MEKICEICGNEFDAKRDSARFCGAKCRKLAFLKQKIKNAKPVIIPENTVSVPESNGIAVSVLQSVRPISSKITKKNIGRPGCDDSYFPDYDLTEDAFIRRNKNWMDFSELFRVHLRESAVKTKEYVANMIVKNLRLRHETESTVSA